MRSIWHKHDLSLKDLHDFESRTMAHYLHMKWEEVGHDFLRMSMPVTDHVRQPYGILHGGASCALAETIGSVGSHLVIDSGTQMCVGMEINANHIKVVREGVVYAIAKPVHLGANSHVWDIRIANEKNQLICISRLTVAIMQKRS